MQRLVAYFGELGPRWGLAAGTCRVHAVLYLAGAAMREADIAATLDLSDEQAYAALADLAQWRMATASEEGRWSAKGEPWDLLFTAMEERRKREIDPALALLRQCQAEMAADGSTPTIAAERTSKLLRLVEDLAAIDLQARRLAPSTLSRVVSFGGQLARLVDRISPPSHPRSSDRKGNPHE